MRQKNPGPAKAMVFHYAVAVLCIAVAGGCRTLPPAPDQLRHTLRTIGCERDSCGSAENQVEVTYLGTSGLLIRYRGAGLLTAPFFSNPVLKRVALSMIPLGRSSFRMLPDTALIERFLPASADNASAILVGHGHYDHLLDVAYIANHRAKSAKIYGGPSIRHTLMGDSALRSDHGSRLVVILARNAGTRERVGVWIYTEDRRFRFMPLVGGHGPAITRLGRSYNFARGRLSKDLTALPISAVDWKLGEPYAYLIDVLVPGDTTSVFRIYYQDAPSTPPYGFPANVSLEQRHIDVAVICAATSTYLHNVPESLLKALAPRNVMVTHWESLFRRGTLSVHFNAAWDVHDFVRRITRGLPPGSKWAMPLPRTIMHFATTAN